MLQIHALHSTSLPLIPGYLLDELGYFSCCVNSQNSSVLAASNCLSCASAGINQKGECEWQWISKWLENLIFPAASVTLNVLNLHYLQYFLLKTEKVVRFCCSLQWKNKCLPVKKTETIMQGLFTIGNITLTIQTSACHPLQLFSYHFSYKISLLHGRYSLILLQIPAEAPFLTGIVKQWVKDIHWNFLCGQRIVQQGYSVPAALPEKSYMSYTFVIILVYLFSDFPIVFIIFSPFLLTILLIMNKDISGALLPTMRICICMKFCPVILSMQDKVWD